MVSRVFEEEASRRDPANNVTTLTGEIEPPPSNIVPLLIPEIPPIQGLNPDNNSYNVVTVPNGADRSALLDGVRVRAGYGDADGTGSNYWRSGAGIRIGTNGASSPLIENCEISNNRVVDTSSSSRDALGAGIAIRDTFDSEPLIIRCRIVGNSVETVDVGGGGGIYIDGASPAIVDCVIRGNKAIDDDGNSSTHSGLGGGVYVINPSGGSSLNATPGVFDCLIEDNRAGVAGGGIDLDTVSAFKDFTVQNCLIIRNSAREGGAVCCNAASLDFVNCTVADNVATMDGGGFFLADGADPDVYNSIIWNNSGGAFAVDGGSVPNHVAHYCCIQVSSPGNLGNDNINANPRFVDVSNRNYRLRDGAGPVELTSPCIDAADTGNVVADEYDVDRDNNKLELMPDRDYFPRAISADIDMGAFENCPADINDDGIVDVDDMTIVMNDFGCCCAGDCDGPGDCGENTDCIGDVDDSGETDDADFYQIIINWGRCTFQPPPESLVDCLNTFPGDPVMAFACFLLYADDPP